MWHGEIPSGTPPVSLPHTAWSLACFPPIWQPALVVFLKPLLAVMPVMTVLRSTQQLPCKSGGKQYTFTTLTCFFMLCIPFTIHSNLRYCQRLPNLKVFDMFYSGINNPHLFPSRIMQSPWLNEALDDCLHCLARPCCISPNAEDKLNFMPNSQSVAWLMPFTKQWLCEVNDAVNLRTQLIPMCLKHIIISQTR
jgi:hypothetical protein